MRRSLAVACLLPFLASGAPATAQDAPLEIEGRKAQTKETGAFCHSNTNRHVDCGNGTVKDSVTGLVWLQRANCTEFLFTGGSSVASWPIAFLAVGRLRDGLCGLTDGSEDGDWRLPSQQEWEATLAYARDGLGCTGAAAPTWTNDAGTGCWTSPTSSYIGIAAMSYWAGTTDPVFPNFAEVGQLTTGASTNQVFKLGNAGIWPVRGRCVHPACTH